MQVTNYSELDVLIMGVQDPAPYLKLNLTTPLTHTKWQLNVEN